MRGPHANVWQSRLLTRAAAALCATVLYATAQPVGEIARADSLYAAEDGVRKLDAFDLMRWAQIVSVRGDLDRAVRLLCRACQRDARTTSLAGNQLARMIDEADSADPRRILGAYEACLRQSALADTTGFSLWLAELYARNGLVPEAIAALTGPGMDSLRSAQRLLDIAQSCMAQKRFADARLPAVAAFRRHANSASRSACAVILYQSYAASGNLDSALSWLRRADLATPANKCEAVALYQRAGLLRPADSLIATLPAGMMRDTLSIRQAWFSGVAATAAGQAAALAGAAAWRTERLTAALWHARALLFANAENASAAVDSINVPPAWPHAAEVLGYQYTARLVRTASDRSAWSSVARARYLGQARQAASASALRACSPAIRNALVSDLAGSLITSQRAREALEAIETVPAGERLPEHRYLRGEALLMHGELEAGRHELEQLILEHPQDVFSIKGRILLSRLDQS